MDTQLNVLTITAQEWNETKALIRSISDKVKKLADKEQKELLTSNEVCADLKIGKTTLQRYMANGILEPVKVNRKKYSKIYFRRADIEKLINEPAY